MFSALCALLSLLLWRHTSRGVAQLTMIWAKFGNCNNSSMSWLYGCSITIHTYRSHLHDRNAGCCQTCITGLRTLRVVIDKSMTVRNICRILCFVRMVPLIVENYFPWMRCKLLRCLNFTCLPHGRFPAFLRCAAIAKWPRKQQRTYDFGITIHVKALRRHNPIWLRSCLEDDSS